MIIACNMNNEHVFTALNKFEDPYYHISNCLAQFKITEQMRCKTKTMACKVTYYERSWTSKKLYDKRRNVPSKV